MISPLFEGYIPGVIVGTYFTTNKEIRAHPALVRAFVKAIQQSLSYASAHPEVARQVIGTYTKIPSSVIPRMELSPWETSLNGPSIVQTEQFMKELGWLKSNVDPNSLIWLGARVRCDGIAGPGESRREAPVPNRRWSVGEGRSRLWERRVVATETGVAGAVRHLRPAAVRPYGWILVLGLLSLPRGPDPGGGPAASDFPPPSLTLASLGRQLGTAAFWVAVGQTLEDWGSGLLLATLLAVPLGTAIGAGELAYRAIRVPLEFLRPIPSVALIPLAILVFETGFTSKLFLVVFASFWPLFIQVLYGMRDIDPLAMDTACSFGLRRLGRVRYVILPAIPPYLATGLRVSSAVALILGVIAKLVIGSPGLGKEVDVALVGGDDRLMYALIAGTGVLGWSINAAFSRMERRSFHWHPSRRMAGRARGGTSGAIRSSGWPVRSSRSEAAIASPRCFMML